MEYELNISSIPPIANIRKAIPNIRPFSFNSGELDIMDLHEKSRPEISKIINLEKIKGVTNMPPKSTSTGPPMNTISSGLLNK